MSVGKVPGWTVAAVMVMVVALGACAWRLETPPPMVTPPGPDEIARDALAQELRGLRQVFDAEAAAPGEQATAGGALLLAHVEAVLPLHEDAVGPVYIPYPHRTSTPGSSVPTRAEAMSGPTTGPYEEMTVRAHITEVRNTALTLAIESEDPSLALLFASIGTSYAFALARAEYADALALVESAQAGNVPEDDTEIDPADMPGAPPADPDATLVTDSPPVLERVADRGLGGTPPVGYESAIPSAQDVEALEAVGVEMGALLVQHDYAAFVYEFARARLGGGTLSGDAARREDVHVRRLDALSSVTGDDPRGLGYSIDSSEIVTIDDMHGLVIATEAAIESAYLSGFVTAVGAGEADAGAWLLVAAVDAHMAQHVWHPTEGYASPVVPAFPGVEISLGTPLP